MRIKAPSLGTQVLSVGQDNMIFVTTAGEIQAAYKAGLVLTGADSTGSPEYMGNNAQWQAYADLTK